MVRQASYYDTCLLVNQNSRYTHKNTDMPRYYFKKAYPKGEQEQSKDFFEIIPFTLLPPAGRGVSFRYSFMTM